MLHTNADCSGAYFTEPTLVLNLETSLVVRDQINHRKTRIKKQYLEKYQENKRYSIILGRIGIRWNRNDNLHVVCSRTTFELRFSLEDRILLQRSCKCNVNQIEEDSSHDFHFIYLTKHFRNHFNCILRKERGEITLTINSTRECECLSTLVSIQIRGFTCIINYYVY